MTNSQLEFCRLAYRPLRPQLLQNLHRLKAVERPFSGTHPCSAFFPFTGCLPLLAFEVQEAKKESDALRIGVVLSGGQAAGGHNVIAGAFDSLLATSPGSSLIGFLNGPSGILKLQWKQLDAHTIDGYRNMGGFDMIGSGRTKIETPEQFAAAREAVQALKLDGLLIIGGDDSNTNAAFLAEDFEAHGLKTTVVGVPKTIDGDLKNEWIEASFGFDSACKSYSEIIGNLARDALSAKKYYYFIKLMGRSASHIALECALQTRPNLTLISEEVALKGQTLHDLACEISDVICKRAEHGKDYGVILIPEGILEFIPECKRLIQELNALLVAGSTHAVQLSQLHGNSAKISYLGEALSPSAKKCYQTMPPQIQQQLFLDRDPHGNVQVSKIETERLFMQLAGDELGRRKSAGQYKGTFSPQPHFCGYEGRSCFPSNFDAHYCYALGHVATLLVGAQRNGYMAWISGLASPVEEWAIGGIPLISMMHEEVRKGELKLVLKKALVDLQGPVFQSFKEQRDQWVVDDAYAYPGPMQFFGPCSLVNAITKTLALESNVKVACNVNGG